MSAARGHRFVRQRRSRSTGRAGFPRGRRWLVATAVLALALVLLQSAAPARAHRLRRAPERVGAGAAAHFSAAGAAAGASGPVDTRLQLAPAPRMPLADGTAPPSRSPLLHVSPPAWAFLESYPPQAIAPKLGASQTIAVDGSLDDEAWREVPWSMGANGFEDIAQPVHPSATIPEAYQTRVKVRWDDAYLYIGAELNDTMIWGNITGHNQYLPNGLAPWWNNDFEVFVDVSGTSHFYKEFEANARNATYDVLWHFPDPGFNSPGVPCNQSVPFKWCTNSTYSHQNWTMMAEDFNTSPSSSGLRTAVGVGGWNGTVLVPWLPRPTHWVIEIAMPIRRSAASTPPGGAHGGLLDADASVDFQPFDPANGARYWWVNFARAEHPLVMLGPDAVSAPDYHGDYYADTCKRVMAEWPTLLGDGLYSCYWEWVWHNQLATRYMHNPEMWGLVQFADTLNVTAPPCRNIEWPARHVLENLLRAQIQHIRQRGAYAVDPAALLDAGLCNASLSCDLAVLEEAVVKAPAVFNVTIDVQGGSSCVDYRGSGRYTGGPCFVATVEFRPPPGATRRTGGSEPTAAAEARLLLTATIREDRYLTVVHSGSHSPTPTRPGALWSGATQGTLCLEDVLGLAGS